MNNIFGSMKKRGNGKGQFIEIDCLSSFYMNRKGRKDYIQADVYIRIVKISSFLRNTLLPKTYFARNKTIKTGQISLYG